MAQYDEIAFAFYFARIWFFKGMPGGALAVFEAYVAVTFVYYCQITAPAKAPQVFVVKVCYCKGGAKSRLAQRSFIF